MRPQNLLSRLAPVVLVAVLAVALAAPAHARPAARSGAPAVASPLAELWGYVSRIVDRISGRHAFQSLFGKEGASLDPDGRPVAPTGDEGASLDPDGAPVAPGTQGGA